MTFFRFWSKVWPTLLYLFMIALLASLVVPVFFRPAPDPKLAGPIVPETALSGPEIAGPVLFVQGDYDVIRLAYETPEAQGLAASFCDTITGSRELSEVILTSATIFNIPVALAFALCSEESGFNPRAVNRANRNLSIDRGLFQLNNAAFPKLTEDEFFNPAINAYYGMAHLRYCLDSAGTEVAGLAMYNAGPNRVRSGGTPKMTLDYVSRIMKRQRQIDALFLSEYLEPVLDVLTEEELTAATFSLLSPPAKP